MNESDSTHVFKQCQRCLKPISEDSVHTCKPTELVRNLESELSATKQKLEADNNLKNLYRRELEQTAKQRNDLARRLEAAEGSGTTSNKYRAELYDEVWRIAKGMGYANVTDALAKLEAAEGRWFSERHHTAILQSKVNKLKQRIKASIEQEPAVVIAGLTKLGIVIEDAHGNDIRWEVLQVGAKLYTVPPIPPDLAELHRENAELKAWKAEAISIMPDYQAIGAELGASIHDKILPAIETLQAENAEIRKQLEALQSNKVAMDVPPIKP
jgi:hypothetical protein